MTLTTEQHHALIRMLAAGRADILAAVSRNQPTGLLPAYTQIDNAISALNTCPTAQNLRIIDTLKGIKTNILAVADSKELPSHLTNCLHLLDDIYDTLALLAPSLGSCDSCGATAYTYYPSPLGMICGGCLNDNEPMG